MNNGLLTSLQYLIIEFLVLWHMFMLTRRYARSLILRVSRLFLWDIAFILEHIDCGIPGLIKFSRVLTFILMNGLAGLILLYFPFWILWIVVSILNLHFMAQFSLKRPVGTRHLLLIPSSFSDPPPSLSSVTPGIFPPSHSGIGAL